MFWNNSKNTVLWKNKKQKGFDFEKKNMEPLKIAQEHKRFLCSLDLQLLDL